MWRVITQQCFHSKPVLLDHLIKLILSRRGICVRLSNGLMVSQKRLVGVALRLLQCVDSRVAIM